MDHILATALRNFILAFPCHRYVFKTIKDLSLYSKTLSRTVKGMMYYQQALKLQEFLYLSDHHGIYRVGSLTGIKLYISWNGNIVCLPLTSPDPSNSF